MHHARTVVEFCEVACTASKVRGYLWLQFFRDRKDNPKIH